MQVIMHHKHAVNITQTERMLSALGGGLLAATGISRRSPGGLALALIGADLMRRGITGHSYLFEALGIRTAPLGQGAETTSVPYELGIRVDASITIAKPRNEVYQFWRNLSNLPRFMRHIESVEESDDTHSHWVIKAPAGRMMEWNAVIHNEVPGEMIAWRSLEGADVDNAGSVWFQDAPGGRGTEIRVELQYDPPAGVVGAAVAAICGKEPSQQIKQDLQHLKEILEAGEVPTTEGQPSARRARERATGKKAADREVQRALEETFPASDAPAYHL